MFQKVGIAAKARVVGPVGVVSGNAVLPHEVGAGSLSEVDQRALEPGVEDQMVVLDQIERVEGVLRQGREDPVVGLVRTRRAGQPAVSEEDRVLEVRERGAWAGVTDDEPGVRSQLAERSQVLLRLGGRQMRDDGVELIHRWARSAGQRSAWTCRKTRALAESKSTSTSASSAPGSLTRPRRTNGPVRKSGSPQSSQVTVRPTTRRSGRLRLRFTASLWRTAPRAVAEHGR